MTEIVSCDFENEAHTRALVRLMNAYMQDAMGGKLHPHEGKAAEALVTGLRQHPAKLVLLGLHNGEFVALSNSFVNFGTFAVKPFVNIHDIVVLPGYRKLGIGRRMMEAIEVRAREMGCGKITLEVREDNEYAQRLYNDLGFGECRPVMHFWTKYL